MPLVPGGSFGPYRIVAPLGRGGMATVFKAYEAGLDRHVALKVLPAEFLHDPAFAERFRREAKVIARIEHPGIVPLYAFGIEGDAPWMAMRLIEGGSLAGLLKRRRPSLAEVAALLRQVAAALDYAHAKGVVHRDVKPQNVLIDGSGHAYLADFGIARMLEGSPVLTHTGTITGTPQYMAPELALGQAPGPACDVYALGIMAYELLAGRVPFKADTPVAVLLKQVSEPVPLPAPGLAPEALLRVTLRCLEKEPQRRWPSATAFAQAFEQALATLPEGAASAPRAAVPAAPGRRDSVTSATLRSLANAGLTPPVMLLMLGGGVASAGLAATVLWLLLGGETRRAGSPGPAPPIATEPAPPPSSLAATLQEDAQPAATPEPSASASARPAATLAPGRPPTPAHAVAPTPLPSETPAPVAAEPAAAVATGSLTLDVDAVRDADDATTETLFLRIELDGRAVHDARLEFSGQGFVERSKRRASFELEALPAGTHSLVVKASSDPGLASRLASGSAQVEVLPGANRRSVRLRYLSETDREVRIR